MFDASSLTDDQKSTIHQWAAEGAQISDIQAKVGSEFGESITYMDARFLVLDLGVEIVTEVEEVKEEEKPERVATGQLTLTVDTIVRVGAAISGTVEFSDGERALWGIDANGQLKMDYDTPGYQPSELDVQVFQDKLREQLQAMQ